jgi:hypothetical protein
MPEVDGRLGVAAFPVVRGEPQAGAARLCGARRQGHRLRDHYLGCVDARPRQAAAEDAIKGLQGIVVRSYTFDQDAAYKPSDLDGVRSQLAAPGWNRLMETRSQKSHANVEIYLMTDANKAVGLAVIASEPRQLTIVNIIGSIDLDKLHKLEGRFGVPKLDMGAAKSPAANNAGRGPGSH